MHAHHRFPIFAAAAAMLVACTTTRSPLQPGAESPAAENDAVPTVPLVLATSMFRPPLDIDTATARGVLEGRFDDWDALGEPSSVLRLVAGPAGALHAPAARQVASDAEAIVQAARSPSMIAVVPASAISPGVRAIRVDALHPLRDPMLYPLRAPGVPPEQVALLFGAGDLMLARRVGDRIRSTDDAGFALRRVASRIASADIAFGNLECTLARLGAPTQGDAFAAPASAAEGLRTAGFDVLSLANNHTGDFGARSLVETVGIVRRNGMRSVGAGRDAEEAEGAVITDAGGMSIGFLSFNAIGETPAARAGRPGAVQIRMQPRLGPLQHTDLAILSARVRALAQRADVVIVMPHWGAQYTRGIHPDQRAVGRALVRAGADAVIGTHSHWAGGIEVYRGAPIAYSLGNFVFDMDLSPQTMQGLAVELILWDGHIASVELLPVRIGDDWSPRFVEGAPARTILADVAAASRFAHPS